MNTRLYSKTWGKLLPITVGSDPEAELYNDNEFIEADEWFEMFTKQLDYTNTFGTEYGKYHPLAQIGCDGHSETAEFRPKAGSIDQHIGNLKNILIAVNKFNDTKVVTSGNNLALGCHIHFGFTNLNSAISIKKNLIADKVSSILGNKIYPLVKRLNGSARGSYANSTAYETKSYGFEYRAFPASIYCCPQLFKYILRISICVVDLVIKKAMPKTKELINTDIKSFLFRYTNLNVREISKFMLIVNSIPNVNTNIVQYWMDDTIPDFKKSELKISFSTDIYHQKVKEILTKKFGQFNIRFFGLSESRGLKFALVGDVFTTSNISLFFNEFIPDTTLISGSIICIGLPYVLRSTEDAAKNPLFIKFVKALSEFIKLHKEEFLCV